MQEMCGTVPGIGKSDRSSLGKQNRDKGQEFQDQVKLGILQLPRICRFRIKDSANEGPADELILVPSGRRILNEIKTTESDRLGLKAYKSTQVSGLLQFERIDPYWNIAITTIRFELPEQHQVFVVRWAAFLSGLRSKRLAYLTREEIAEIGIPVPPLTIGIEQAWDFSQVWPFGGD
ncbi:MAG: hypothetical protein WA118_08160 [Carboxydocellales bacterium]